VAPTKTTDAGKLKLDRNAALKLAKTMNKIVVVTRTRKLLAFDMANHPPQDSELLAVILGPTGNLRAPAFRKGSTLVVGFTEDAYDGVIS
jgi:hypothetical protein